MINSRVAETPANPQQARLGQPIKRMARVLVRALLISSMLTACVVLGGSSLPALMGFKTMVVTSGSMNPTIAVGYAVVIRPAVPPDSIRLGDMITFRAGEATGMVTHRVKAIRQIQGRTYYQTQGDANATPDPNLTAAEAVYGKVKVTLPKLGFLLYFVTTDWGKLFFIGVPLFILVALEVRGLLRAKKRPQPDKEGPYPYEAAPYETSSPS